MYCLHHMLREFLRRHEELGGSKGNICVDGDISIHLKLAYHISNALEKLITLYSQARSSK